MQKKLFYLIFIILHLPSISIGQKKLLNQVAERKVVYNLQDNYTIEATIRNENIKPKIDRLYYWYWKNTITSNYGGQNGLLLHGNYIKYDKDKNLIEKVNFYKGSPNGKFYYWHTNGVIFKVENWKKGKIKGTVKNYDNEGKLVLKQQYKNGKIHGKQNSYFDGIEKRTEIYKNGNFIKAKEQKEKKEQKENVDKKEKEKKPLFKNKDSDSIKKDNQRKSFFKNSDGKTKIAINEHKKSKENSSENKKIKSEKK